MACHPGGHAGFIKYEGRRTPPRDRGTSREEAGFVITRAVNGSTSLLASNTLRVAIARRSDAALVS